MYKYIFILLLFSCNKSNDLIKLDNNTYDSKMDYTPFWIFGHHVWEDNKNNKEAVDYIVYNYNKYSINMSSIIFDSPWANSYNDFIIDTSRYNNYKLLFKKLQTLNIKKIFWLTGFQNINSYDALISKSTLYNFFSNNLFYVNNGNNYKWWKGEGAHVDFYNYRASLNFTNLLNNFEYADGWKLDEGYSYLPSKLKIFNNDSVNNINFGNKFYSEITKSQFFKKRITLGRAFSSQGFEPRLHSLPDNVTIAWCGDHRGDNQGISEQLYDIYKSISYGHNLLCWEIGGYNFPAPKKNDLINSVKIGSLLPIMSNGGRNGGLTNHLPWFHDKETTLIYKKFVDLHYNLMPFFYSETINYGKKNLLNKNILSDNSYYIANTIVVFNNFNSENTFRCNFDTNFSWINILNDDIINSSSINFKSDLYNISAYIKSGSIIPFYNFYNNNDTISFKIYPYSRNAKEFILPLNYEDKNCKVTVDYNTMNGFINVSSNCNKILKINIKSKLEPKFSQNLTNWSYDYNSKWITIISKSNNFSTKIDNLKNYYE